MSHEAKLHHTMKKEKYKKQPISIMVMIYRSNCNNGLNTMKKPQASLKYWIPNLTND